MCGDCGHPKWKHFGGAEGKCEHITGSATCGCPGFFKEAA